MNRRLVLQRQTEKLDALGGFSETWTDRQSVWAQIRPLRGTEQYVAEQQKATVTHRIRLRAGIEIDSLDRFKEEGAAGRIFTIAAVLDYDDANEILEIDAIVQTAGAK